MIGAIIGDIVGSRFEFGAVPQKGFELFTPDCSYTDDTICTMAIADAVLNVTIRRVCSTGVGVIQTQWAAMAIDSINGLTQTTLCQ